MITIRKSNARGNTKTEWLNSFHTFSFADYYDEKYPEFGTLRVINEDTVQPGMGFGMHPHRDMEIITYVVEGELEHKDSMGTGSVIKPGEIQKMSAGKGVRHSEFNHSKNNVLHLLQIWIMPNKMAIPPAYEQQKIPTHQLNEFIIIGSPQGGEHAVTIHQDVLLYVAYLTTDTMIDYKIKNHRKVWLQVVKGQLKIANLTIEQGDGVAIENETRLSIKVLNNSEVLLFDIA